jgi:hypothetical protein
MQEATQREIFDGAVRRIEWDGRVCFEVPEHSKPLEQEEKALLLVPLGLV